MRQIFRSATLHLLAPAALLLLTSGHAAAQSGGPTSLDGDYHAGFMMWEHRGGGEYQTEALSGSVEFSSSGGVSFDLTKFFQDSSGAGSEPSTGPATYTIETQGPRQGLVTIDDQGVELFDFWVNSSAEVLHMARSYEVDPADFGVLIKKSAGLDESVLSGAYRFVSYRTDWWDPAGPSLETEVGRLVFDGTGGVTVSLTATDAQLGTVTTETGNDLGLYSVASDGAFETTPLYNGALCGAGVPTSSCDWGAVTADGEFGFAVAGGVGSDPGLMFFVRENADPDLTTLAGRYGYTRHAMSSAQTFGNHVAETLLGIANAGASTPTAGTWAGEEAWVASSGNSNPVEDYDPNANGTLTVNGGAIEVRSAGELTVRIWPSSNYRYVIGEQLQVIEAVSPADWVVGAFLATRMDAAGASRYCSPGALNSTGASGRIDVTGSMLLAQNDLVLQAESLPSNSFGFFLASQSQGFAANPGGSQGNLCLSGSIGRYVGPGQILNAGTAGAFSLPIDTTQVPQPTGFTSVTSGDSWNFQAWHRDSVQGVAVSNFTDAIEISFE
jgi:hypothetical protein